MSQPKATNLKTADELLSRAEQLEADLRRFARDLPPGVSSLVDYIGRTADCAGMVVVRLHRTYNGVRRYDHG